MAESAPSETARTPWQRWNAELDMARKARGYREWCHRGKKIIRRYRDERAAESGWAGDGASDGAETGSRFNILWSNVQTLMPAVFAKAPKPVVERRYLDRDDAGRTASVILERGLLYEIDSGSYFDALRRAVLDRLLPGRGQIWVRYEPTFRNVPSKTQEVGRADGVANPRAGGAGGGAGDPATGMAGRTVGPAAGYAAPPPAPSVGGRDAALSPAVENQEPEVEKIYECVAVDYLDWQDFLTSTSRTWEEVWWVAKRVYMTRAEMEARWPGKGGKVKLDWTPAEVSQAGAFADVDKDLASKGKIWEIWNKRDRKVIWITEASNKLGEADTVGGVLQEIDDPLGLDEFFPCPKPLSATLTNETMIPIPDYAEYQDQAVELDDLTQRISALTTAIRVRGIYDASVPELQRILTEGVENELIPTENWADFSSKMTANSSGSLWLLPIADMAATLVQLYEARERVKQILYELTGISDIVRGQGSGPAKTATEQRIKGQFASMRLNEMQQDVQRFARDVLRIMAEIIAEHYSDETLFLVSSYEQYAREQFLPRQGAAPPQAQPGQPGMGHNGGPPMGPPEMNGAMPPSPPSGGMGAASGEPGIGPAGQQPPMAAQNGMAMLPPMAGMIGQAPPPPSPAQQAAELFAKSVKLLRNDKLRGFRIDIETDSMIEPDQQAVQQARTELLGAVAQFLPQAMLAGQQMPEMQPLLGQLLLYFLRGFRAGRDLEGMFEQFIDDLQVKAKNPAPKPPSPEQIKAQAEQQKQQSETQRMQMQAQIDSQKGQQDMELANQKAEIDIARERAKLEIERERMELERQKMQMEIQAMQMKAGVEAQSLAMKADADRETATIDAEAREREAELSGESREREHEIGLEVMEQKRKDARAGKRED